MIIKQMSLTFSSYMELYDLVVPKDNMLRQINELVDFTFVYGELVRKPIKPVEWRKKKPGALACLNFASPRVPWK